MPAAALVGRRRQTIILSGPAVETLFVSRCAPGFVAGSLVDDSAIVQTWFGLGVARTVTPSQAPLSYDLE